MALPIATRPRSADCRPAAMFRRVDLPHPMNPTMEMNSPRSTVRFTSSRTCRTFPLTLNDLETPWISMNANGHSRAGLDRAQPRLGHAHQAVEAEADESDRQDREEDVGVDQDVVLL